MQMDPVLKHISDSCCIFWWTQKQVIQGLSHRNNFFRVFPKYLLSSIPFTFRGTSSYNDKTHLEHTYHADSLFYSFNSLPRIKSTYSLSI